MVIDIQHQLLDFHVWWLNTIIMDSLLIVIVIDINIYIYIHINHINHQTRKLLISIWKTSAKLQDNCWIYVLSDLSATCSLKICLEPSQNITSKLGLSVSPWRRKYDPWSPQPNDLKAIPTMLAIWALRSPAGRMSHVASYDRRPRRSSTSGFGAI